MIAFLLRIEELEKCLSHLQEIMMKMKLEHDNVLQILAVDEDDDYK
jgi:hypothetical protein